MVGGLSVKPIKGDAVLFWSMVCFLNVALLNLCIFVILVKAGQIRSYFLLII